MTDLDDNADEPEALRTRTPRASVLLSAVIERFGGTDLSFHRVRDLSSTGMRIDQADPLRQGATVLVTVGTLEAVGATVMWITGGTAGLKFANAIDPDRARANTAIAPKRQKASFHHDYSAAEPS